MPPKAKVKSAKVVVYIGTAGVRVIDKEGWRNIGAKDGTVVWAKENDWQVPVDEFSDEALVYLDEAPDFVVKGVSFK